MGRNEIIQIEVLIETKNFLYKTFDLPDVDAMISFLPTGSKGRVKDSEWNKRLNPPQIGQS